MALLKVRDLTKRFEGLTANSEINLEIPEGSLFAVIGPNGAGKTTFFNMISGFMQPTAGTIEFAGKDVTDVRQDKIAAMGLVRTFQLVQLFKGMTVAENVEVGFHLATKGGVAAALTRVGWFRRQEAEVHAEARKLLAVVGLADQAEQDAELLPYGQQRLLEVARALAAKPRLLLLDEPAAGLNTQETDALAKVVQQINAQGDYRALDRARRGAGHAHRAPHRRSRFRLQDHRRHAGRNHEAPRRHRRLSRHRGGRACLASSSSSKA